jgi:hypothetical protein
MPTGGGGDAAPADSGADASVRLAGRTARTRLINVYFISCSCLANYGASEAVYPCVVVEKIHESF